MTISNPDPYDICPGSLADPSHPPHHSGACNARAAKVGMLNPRPNGLMQGIPIRRTTFTREEVLTVLRAKVAEQQALIMQKTPEAILRELAAIFERLE